MSKENFYIAIYVAILDYDFNKIMKLSQMSEEDTMNYPNQHPKLKFNKIFKDNNPFEFLNLLAKKYKLELSSSEYESITLSLELLQIKDSVIEKDKNSKEIEESYIPYPLLGTCHNSAAGTSIVKSLLSISYSKIINKEEMASTLTNLITKPIVNEVLAIVAMSSFVYDKKPLSIFLTNKVATEFGLERRVEATYNYYYNYIVIPLKDSSLTHELTHKALDMLFNNKGKPYNLNSKEKYHHALKSTLINVLEAFKDEGIIVNNVINQTSSSKMGKALYKMLDQPSSTLSEIDFFAFKTLLFCYDRVYKEEAEDVEFIVAFPSLIAGGFYEGKIVQILQPLEQYWQEVISPAATEYLDKHDPSKICLPLGDLQDLLP